MTLRYLLDTNIISEPLAKVPNPMVLRRMRDLGQTSFPISSYDESAATWHASQRARLDATGRAAPFED